jgi:hypothetical protein
MLWAVCLSGTLACADGANEGRHELVSASGYVTADDGLRLFYRPGHGGATR